MSHLQRMFWPNPSSEMCHGMSSILVAAGRLRQVLDAIRDRMRHLSSFIAVPRGCDGFFISLAARIGPSLAGRGGETGQIVRMPRSPTLRVMIRVGSSTVGWTTERLASDHLID